MKMTAKEILKQWLIDQGYGDTVYFDGRAYYNQPPPVAGCEHRRVPVKTVDEIGRLIKNDHHAGLRRGRRMN